MKDHFKTHISRLRKGLFTIGLFSSGLLYAQCAAGPGIVSDSLCNHVAFLAGDALRGRAVGTSGCDIAAQYIHERLSYNRLKPVSPLTDFYQPIPLHGSVALAGSRLQLHIHEQSLNFHLGRDYLLYSYGSPTYVAAPLPLVFVGYGIVAPEYDYNDYANEDVSGKIVVFLSGEPHSTDPAYFAGEEDSPYAVAETKERLAIARGAAGSVMILNPQEMYADEWAVWQKEFSFEDVSLTYGATSHLALVMHPQAAVSLFLGSAISFADVLRMSQHHSMRSVALAGRLAFHGVFQQRDFISANVLAVVEGSDPEAKKDYIVVTAHYDHLGVGPAVAGDSIYNGAVDNALAVAGLLEMTRCLSQTEHHYKRSILFLFTTAEEKGLLGARYFLDQSLVPHYRMIANINLEGLAFFDRFHDVIAIGGELSHLGDWLGPLAKEYDLAVGGMPSGFSSWDALLHSDQMAFARAGIPCMLIVDGLHGENLPPEEMALKRLEWLHNRYHTPRDDLEQPLNYQAAEQHARFLMDVIIRLADSSFKPDWLPWAPFRTERLRSIAEKK